MKSWRDAEEKLPFPTKPLMIGDVVIEEFVIPDDKREEVLKHLYPFAEVPSLDDELYDLHEGKLFRVRDYRVTWEYGMNYLVSPYYTSSGGTVIDWMPAEWSEIEGEDLIDVKEITGVDEHLDEKDCREDDELEEFDDEDLPF